MGNPGYGAIGEEAPPPYQQEEPASPQPRQEALRPDAHLVALPEDEAPAEHPYANLEQVTNLAHTRYDLRCKKLPDPDPPLLKFCSLNSPKKTGFIGTKFYGLNGFRRIWVWRSYSKRRSRPP